MRVVITGIEFPVETLSGRKLRWKKLTLSCGHDRLERERFKAELGDMRYCKRKHLTPAPTYDSVHP